MRPRNSFMGRPHAGLGSPSRQGWCMLHRKAQLSRRGGPSWHVPSLAAVRKISCVSVHLSVTLGKASGKNNWNDPDRVRSCYPSSEGLREGDQEGREEHPLKAPEWKRLIGPRTRVHFLAICEAGRPGLGLGSYCPSSPGSER